MNLVSLRGFVVQEILLTAQRALAVVYEDGYPCSNAVRQGLEGILYQRFGGSQHDFTNVFLRPTILLLERLKAKVNTRTNYTGYVCLI